jgi:hypothetical protein
VNAWGDAIGLEPRPTAHTIGQQRSRGSAARIAEARALAGPACAPSLGWIAEWAQAMQLARSGSAAESLTKATRAASELEANAERYTAARLMTDLLPVLRGQPAASAAAGIADRLDAMGAHASAAEARAAV